MNFMIKVGLQNSDFDFLCRNKDKKDEDSVKKCVLKLGEIFRTRVTLILFISRSGNLNGDTIDNISSNDNRRDNTSDYKICHDN